MLKEEIPLTSLLLVVRNEEKALPKILKSYADQTYPNIEIIVVDGESTDGTKEEAEKILLQIKENRNVNVQILDNPEKILAAGWSKGIKAANGEFLCRIDAHSEIKSDYIEKAVALLQSEHYSQAISVGGVIVENVAVSFFGRLSADLFGSKFGIGNSKFRNPPTKLVESDTSGFGVFRRPELAKYEFNTNLQRNQDIELIKRIRSDGWKLYINPEMHVRYETRNTLFKLLCKGFNDGFWIPFSGGYLRHWIPFCFLAYLVIVAVVVSAIAFCEAPSWGYCVCLPLVAYAMLALMFAIKDGSTLISKLVLPLLFFAYHLSYGLGTFCGCVKKIVSGS